MEIKRNACLQQLIRKDDVPEAEGGVLLGQFRGGEISLENTDENIKME